MKILLKKKVKCGESYDYPAGYRGYALKVLGQFEEDDWINGPESKQWVTVYHGTTSRGAKRISNKDLSKIFVLGFIQPLI